jgi:hypothetical protein
VATCRQLPNRQAAVEAAYGQNGDQDG